jgi:acyl-[acyl-carrier-protein] desaturase
MSASSRVQEKMYLAYLEFQKTAERKRRWNIFDDIPWNKLDSSRNTERAAICIETFCAEEMYLPDYASNGISLMRPRFGAAWFQICWSYEESRHGLVFREYLRRSGMRSGDQLAALEKKLFARAWTLPFETARQMACYGALQETATYLAYKAQKDRAHSEGNQVLEAIFKFVSRDEAAHAGFYRTIIELEMAEDRENTIADLALVIAQFKMPGDGLIPDYQRRLTTSGAGISTRHFLAHGLFPTLTSLGTSREELRAALRRRPAVLAASLAKA